MHGTPKSEVFYLKTTYFLRESGKSTNERTIRDLPDGSLLLSSSQTGSPALEEQHCCPSDGCCERRQKGRRQNILKLLVSYKKTREERDRSALPPPLMLGIRRNRKGRFEARMRKLRVIQADRSFIINIITTIATEEKKISHKRREEKVSREKGRRRTREKQC